MDERVTQKPHTSMTEEDVAFAAAQWGSGISQREIAKIFGYANSSQICSHIGYFIHKYVDSPRSVGWYQGNERRRLVKSAVAAFVAQRIRRELDERVTP
jgi:hypothetical protein